MQMDIEQLRWDWRTARAWLRDAEGWPLEDLEAVGAELRRAIGAGDEAALDGLAAWVASWAGVARAAAQRSREAEERMRVRARAERAEREQAKGMR